MVHSSLRISVRGLSFRFCDHASVHGNLERRRGGLYAKLLQDMLAVHRDRIETAVELFRNVSRRESLPQQAEDFEFPRRETLALHHQ